MHEDVTDLLLHNCALEYIQLSLRQRVDAVLEARAEERIREDVGLAAEKVGGGVDADCCVLRRPIDPAIPGQRDTANRPLFRREAGDFQDAVCPELTVDLHSWEERAERDENANRSL